MKSCPSCAFESPASMKFCGSCGAKLSEGPNPSSQGSAERRHVSVVFCDLADSTELASNLDPEEFRSQIQEYQGICVAKIESLGGHVAQYLGDGILAYFGFPRAQEDDTIRAVLSGLRIIEALAERNDASAEGEANFRCRIGVHAGLTVAGTVGAGSKLERLALGPTPNIAARLQAAAQPGALLITKETLPLLKGVFETEEVGELQFKGVREVQHVYRVTSEKSKVSHLPNQEFTSSILIERQEELEVLKSSWDDLKKGIPSTIAITGEAGMGKSFLMNKFQKTCEGEDMLWLTAECSPYNQGTAFSLFTMFIERAAGFTPADSEETRAQKLLKLPVAEEQYPYLGELVLTEAQSKLSGVPPEMIKKSIIKAIQDLVKNLAAEKPFVLWLDDLHWADASSLELITSLVNADQTDSILLLLTYRAFSPLPWENEKLKLIELTPLTIEGIRSLMMSKFPEGAPPEEIITELCERATGIPLFASELANMTKELDDKRVPNKNLATTIPLSLKGLMLARLDQLGDAKKTAQWCSILGRKFDLDLLLSVVGESKTLTLESLDTMVTADVLQPIESAGNTSYTFRHALLRDAAYESLLKSDLKVHHSTLADTLLDKFPDSCSRQPALLAQHLTDADRISEAVDTWLKAGKRAIRLFANVEAVSHFNAGLALTPRLDLTETRKNLELEFHTGLGPALIATQGYASTEVERTYSRALELCQEAKGENPDLFWVLWGLGAYYNTRGPAEEAFKITTELLHIAENTGNPIHFCEANFGRGAVHLLCGEFEESFNALSKARSYIDKVPNGRTELNAVGSNPAVSVLCNLAVVAQLLGKDELASTTSDEGVSTARQITAPHIVASSLAFQAWYHQLKGETEEVLKTSEEVLSLSKEFPFWMVLGTMLNSWARVKLKKPVDLEQLEGMIAGFQGSGVRMFQTYFFTLLSDIYLERGEIGAGLSAASRGLKACAEVGERHSEAELIRIQGEFELLNEQTKDAEHTFSRAMNLAQEQRALNHQRKIERSMRR